MRIFQQSKQALGTEAMLTIALDEAEKAATIFDELWKFIDEFEQAFSRFLPSSELSIFNSQAGNKVRVTSEFRGLLEASKAMAKKTDGLFNPFILPALQRVGYKKSWVDPHREGPDFLTRHIVSADSLLIEGDSAVIPEDSALDSGGIGKGYLLDQLGELLEKRRVKNYWISLGGDILVRGQMDDNAPWEIDIVDALRPDKIAATVTVPVGTQLAIATSGTTKRAGVHEGKKWHHIIDPKTGQPAKTDIMTAAVCMPSGVEADVFASCIVALGSENYQKFVKAHTIKDVMIQTKAGEDTDISVIGSLLKVRDA